MPRNTMSPLCAALLWAEEAEAAAAAACAAAAEARAVAGALQQAADEESRRQVAADIKAEAVSIASSGSDAPPTPSYHDPGSAEEDDEPAADCQATEEGHDENASYGDPAAIDGGPDQGRTFTGAPAADTARSSAPAAIPRPSTAPTPAAPEHWPPGPALRGRPTPQRRLGGRRRHRSRSRTPADARDRAASAYARTNDLDAEAAQALADCPPPVLQRVLRRGDLPAARNRSALLMSRIREAREDQVGAALEALGQRAHRHRRGPRGSGGLSSRG